MDEAAVQKLIESAVSAAQAPLLARALRGDARELATTILAPITLAEASKARVIADVLSHKLPMKDGTLDAAKFTEAVNAAAKVEGAYVASLLGSGQVRNMNSVLPVAETADPVKIAEQEASVERASKNRVRIMADLMGGNIKAAEAAIGYKGAA